MHVSIIIIITYFYNFYMLEKRWIFIENAYIFVFLFYPPLFLVITIFHAKIYLFIYLCNFPI